MQTTQLTTKEKEEYLQGKRSKTVQNAIDKSQNVIPYDMQISLHYSYIKAMAMVKRKYAERSSNSGSEINNKVQY